MQPIILVLLVLTISACIVRSKPTRPKFMAFVHQNFDNKHLLIKKIDKAEWKIGYRYAAKCPPQDKQNNKALEAEMTKALEAWLQPLRELQPAQPITRNFRYQPQKDFNADQSTDVAGLLAVDVRITFECRQGHSFALVGGGTAPDLHIRGGTKITLPLLSKLIHELGHAFGLGDTYIHSTKLASTGGLERTSGKQPSSIMAAFSAAAGQPPYLGEDDKRGIQWLYRHFYQGIALDNCIFPDYVYEPEPAGCRPKYPLIFEVKHAQPGRIAVDLMNEDPSIDINAQDDGGFTALHYAVMREDEAIVKSLLAHEDIKPYLRNKQGYSALELAREAKLKRMIVLLLKHPLASGAVPHDKQITTWGEMKRGDN